jgi:hypothetical protein
VCKVFASAVYLREEGQGATAHREVGAPFKVPRWRKNTIQRLGLVLATDADADADADSGTGVLMVNGEW